MGGTPKASATRFIMANMPVTYTASAIWASVHPKARKRSTSLPVIL